MGLQVPVHDVCCGFKAICEHTTLPLTWDSGVTKQQ